MILEPTVLDGVGFSEDGQTEALAIFDHLDWEDEKEHLLLLQNKINHYLVFIQGGQEELSPQDRERLKSVRQTGIEIYFNYKPSKECRRFLKKVQRIVSNMGDYAELERHDHMKENAGKLKNVRITYQVTG